MYVCVCLFNLQSLCPTWDATVSIQQTEQDGGGRDDVWCHGLHATIAGQWMMETVWKTVFDRVWSLLIECHTIITSGIFFFLHYPSLPLPSSSFSFCQYHLILSYLFHFYHSVISYIQRASAISPENSIIPNTIDMALQPSREVSTVMFLTCH